MPDEIMIVAGEASGDAHAAELIAELRRRRPELRFFGCGGEAMAAAGCDRLVSTADLAVMGLLEVVRHLPRLHGHLRRLRRALATRRPAAVILVDFPDFNLRLAAAAHAAGIPVIYFISPQLWAWRGGRVKQIQKHVRRMITIFPFEAAFYVRHGVQVASVGHPLVERVGQALAAVPDAAAFRARHGLEPDTEMIALLPGSRKHELNCHLAPMLETARRLHAERHVEFVLPVAPGLSLDEVATAVPPPVRSFVHLAPGAEMVAALAHARLAIVASGTATVETALVGTPMIVVYRVSPLTYQLGRRLVRTPHVAMVNLIAERQVVPELIQSRFRPAAVQAQALPLLAEGDIRAVMLTGLAEVRQRLGPAGAISRAADTIAHELWS